MCSMISGGSTSMGARPVEASPTVITSFLVSSCVIVLCCSTSVSVEQAKSRRTHLSTASVTPHAYICLKTGTQHPRRIRENRGHDRWCEATRVSQSRPILVEYARPSSGLHDYLAQIFSS